MKEVLVVGFIEFPYLIDFNEFHLILPHNRPVDSSVTMNEAMFGERLLKQPASVMLKSAAAHVPRTVSRLVSFTLQTIIFAVFPINGNVL